MGVVAFTFVETLELGHIEWVDVRRVDGGWNQSNVFERGRNCFVERQSLFMDYVNINS